MEVTVKKVLAMLALVALFTSAAFSYTYTEKEKDLLPVYKEDINKVEYKIIASSDTDIIVEINGVIYVYKLK
jgi:hypothetical protein